MKKIDTSKSLIFESTVEDVKNSLEYLDQEGYFSNSDKFLEYEEYILDLVQTSKDSSSYYTFICNGTEHAFEYFIPKSKAVFVEEEPKKKTWRQFKSIGEFFKVTGFNIGEVVKINNYNYEETSVFNGFRIYTYEEYHRIDVIFGSGSRTLDELFKRFKYYKNGEWLPFGVEE